MTTVLLEDAVSEIKQACSEVDRPFFFIVGAGISHPPIPLVRNIIMNVKKWQTDMVLRFNKQLQK